MIYVEAVIRKATQIKYDMVSHGKSILKIYLKDSYMHTNTHIHTHTDTEFSGPWFTPQIALMAKHGARSSCGSSLWMAGAQVLESSELLS